MTNPSGGAPLPPLAAENADLRRRLAQAEQTLLAERERSKRISSSNPFGLSEQLRDDLAGIIELLPAFVGIFTPEGRMVFVNSSGCTMLDLDPVDVARLDVRDLHPRVAAGPGFNEALLAAQTSGHWSGEGALRHRSGREIPVIETVMAHRSAGGSVRYFSLVARDVTERNLAMDLRREQDVLLDNAHEAIVEVGLDGKIILWNHGAEFLYGWTAKEATGRRFPELIGSDESEFEAARRTAIATGKWAGEVGRVNRKGESLLVESRWSLLRDDHGGPKAFIIISADMTEKKRLTSQFLRAQRMESIGRLAGGIAHDLNNVLTPILMGVSVLRRRLTDETSLKLLDTFELGAQRGAAMVKQVLAFSRGIEGQRMPIAPAHLLQEVENLLHETLPKSIEVETRAARDAWPVLGDVTQLHQVLLNLCINARDAMPQGGRLVIDAANVVVDQAYALGNPDAKPGPHVLIRVVDTGTGIPAAIRDKIFEPFFTTKEMGKGTGLGLSTVHTIVQSHGGFIHVYSEERKGTTFKVYLPAEPTGKVPVEATGEQPPPRGRGELVLVVDDEEIIRDTARAVLERGGYRVLLARDGSEGLALFVQNLAAIDVVLTDITMPIMDGIATMRALKRIWPEVRIVCASGIASDRQFAVLTDAGMSHFLPKPFTTESLLQTIHRALQRTGPPAR